MSVTQPFVPTPFATPIINPQTASLFRRTPYISPSEYRNAPTAVSTNDLVPGGSASDNLASLANTIWRASAWLDTICTHTADGTLAASPATQSKWVKPKPDGTLALICNYKPILEVDSIAVGVVPSQLQTLNQNSANNLWIDGKIITLTAWSYPQSATNPPTAPFGYPVNRAGGLFCVWVYVNGWPHTALTANVAQGATSITVAPSTPDGTSVSGIYGAPNNTQLTIHDGTNTEVVVVSSVSGLTLTLAGPTVYAHTVPTAPDSIRVSAIPWDVEQACISLTSCLIKMRGSRAMVMSQMPGGTPAKTAVAEAGGLEDYMTAVDILAPYTTVYMN